MKASIAFVLLALALLVGAGLQVMGTDSPASAAGPVQVQATTANQYLMVRIVSDKVFWYSENGGKKVDDGSTDSYKFIGQKVSEGWSVRGIASGSNYDGYTLHMQR